MSGQKQALFYDFGPFRLDESARVVLRGTEVVQLALKAFEILSHLVKNRGQVVSKEVLIRQVWPDCFVEENNLSQNISALRRALADDAENPKYIETIPRRGYRFVGEVKETYSRPEVPGKEDGTRGPRIRSLAVLPFQSIGSAVVDFLDVGLADALITKLSNLEQIEVRPTASILRYKGVAPNWVQAGAELNADALLSGCIQSSGEKIRVTVQLVSAADGLTLWAGQFDEPFTDIFSVEDSISQQVARTLMLKLSSEDRRRLSHRNTTNPDAYQAYLRGRHFWNRRTELDLQKSVRCFQEAVDHDPSYALAYAGLADSYTVLGGYGILAPNESYLRARGAAQQALEIDERLAEAHTSLGDVFMYYDWNGAAAEQEYQRAIELRPDYATAHHFYAWYLIAKGEFAEAAKEMRRAQELEPLSPMINTTVGFPYYFEHDFESAIRQIEKALEMDPQFGMAQLYLGRAYLYSGRHQQALELIRKASTLPEMRPMRAAALAHALAVAGQCDEARQILAELIALREKRYVSAYYLASVYAGLREADQALAWLERGFEERVNQMVILHRDPAWDSLRSEPRFSALVRKVGF